MIYVWLILFLLLVVALWSLNFAGLPGNWLIILLSITWNWIGPADYSIEWIWFIPLVVLALAGEAVEFLASILGTKKLGGSNRGATLSVGGGIAGAVIGAFLGVPIPIPIVGILIGSVLFASLGAMGGAMLGEHWEGKTFKESAQIGGAAFLGRLLGTVGKILFGAIIVVVLMTATLFF